MKKVLLALLLIVLPVTVFAAENLSVTKLELTNDKQVITFKGEMEDGSLAVMCKLYNSKDEEVDLYSTDVTANKFEGTFTVDKNDTYKVSCANYEGGEIKSETIVVKNANPKTGDSIYLYLTIGFISIIAIIGCTKFFKKEK